MSVHLWHASLLLPAHEISRREKLLSTDERERASRFLATYDRDRFIAARGLLRTILSEYQHFAPQEIAFHYNEYGKPSMRREENIRGLEFNLAHSEDALLIGITHHRKIGVDIERIYPDGNFSQRVKRFFTPEEQAAFNNLPPLEQRKAWFQTWTIKEAYLKAVGTGLTQPLKTVAVEALEWHTEIIPHYDGFAAAMVLEGKPPASIQYYHL
jgi:4'-phosphopantetheinyl transferase